MMLYRVPELYAGALFFPIERTAEVLHTWRQWTDTVPDEVTSIGRILRLPSLPEIPEFMRGRAWAMVEAACLGGAVVGAELIRPLRALGPELDTFATIPAPGLQRLHMEPEQPVPAEGDGALLADLPAGALDALVALAGPDADTPLLSIEIRHLAGALSRQAPGGGALAKIDGTYAVFATGFTPTAVLGDEVRAHARALKDALRVWRADHDYYNFVESPAEAAVAFPHASYQRLREIKARYDPDQMIISTHPVRPGAEMRRIEAVQETPTPTSVLQAVAGTTIDCELLEWSPDLLALTGVLRVGGGAPGSRTGSVTSRTSWSRTGRSSRGGREPRLTGPWATGHRWVGPRSSTGLAAAARATREWAAWSGRPRPAARRAGRPGPPGPVAGC
jgi:hypothetical protein